MIYWALFIGSLMLSGYHFLLDSANQYISADINSAVNYIDRSRIALAEWKKEHTGEETEVAFEELLFPQEYQKRNDVRFFVNDEGIYIAIEHPPRGLAETLAEKYSSATGSNGLQWHLGYYHVGFKNANGCLSTVLYYKEESQLAGDCTRPLPATINSGDLVLTDRDSQG